MSGLPEVDHQHRKHRLPAGRPVKRLVDIELTEISCVDVPANSGARHVLHKHVHMPEPELLDAGTLDAVVAAEVAKAVARIWGAADRAGAAASCAERQPVAKAAPDVVGEALELARGRADRPVAYWRGALQALGRSLAPDTSPSTQLQAALRDPRGKVLTQAAAGDYRELRG